ncbi:hypothetical protein KUH03_03205 [Sphingobacterium sp. E70]|nr:heavy metal-binding domain-containing protein [Sphingobacterium sp. E70]ULT25994.1 hypothetical protein KUH03_03205 [Sphingobacterium sp. E70]
MSCDGCRTTIENAINQLPEVRAKVTLEPPLLTIESAIEIPTEQLQETLAKLGNYHIGELNKPVQEILNTEQPKLSASSKYYCPMHCEGDKTYDQPGRCPVCGMYLVPMQNNENKHHHPDHRHSADQTPTVVTQTKIEQQHESIMQEHNHAGQQHQSEAQDHDHHQHESVQHGHDYNQHKQAHNDHSAAAKPNQRKASSAGKYYCPMHCEGDKLYDKPGNCPVCGMNLEKVPELTKSTQYSCPMHPKLFRIILEAARSVVWILSLSLEEMIPTMIGPIEISG